MMAYTDNPYRNWLFLVATGIFLAQLLDIKVDKSFFQGISHHFRTNAMLTPGYLSCTLFMADVILNYTWDLSI